MPVLRSKQPLMLVSVVGMLTGCPNDPFRNLDGMEIPAVDMTQEIPPLIPGCTGACVVNRQCSTATGPTTITGTVTIPAGTLPLYNAKVYVPTGTSLPTAPQSGASCDRCDAVTDAIASTTTDINGKFVLTNVPSGQNIPLIIRVGKWRKVITIPAIGDCTTTMLSPDQTRLPRNKSEGNIPRIALSVGGADAMECLLRKNKLGLDDSEFTTENGDGRVNLYAGANGVNKFASGLNGGALFTAAVQQPGISWWDRLDNLTKYDIVMLSCEGAEFMNYKSSQALANLEQYLAQGGRVFGSHFHYGWIKHADPVNQSIQKVVTGWNPSQGPDPADEQIDRSFAKGAALADWLMLPQVSGSSQLGAIQIKGTRYSVASIDPMLTQRWVYYPSPLGPSIPQYFSFNAPVGATSGAQCGQMVFTDLHISGGGNAPFDTSPNGGTFPTSCVSTSLSAQEKALIFMLFDLTNCLTPIVP